MRLDTEKNRSSFMVLSICGILIVLLSAAIGVWFFKVRVDIIEKIESSSEVFKKNNFIRDEKFLTVVSYIRGAVKFNQEVDRESIIKWIGPPDREEKGVDTTIMFYRTGGDTAKGEEFRYKFLLNNNRCTAVIYDWINQQKK